MIIAIDIRPLMKGVRTGVGMYTYGLVEALLKADTLHHYVLFSNGLFTDGSSLRYWHADNVQYVHTRYPNKIFHTLLKVTGRPYLDVLILSQAKQKLEKIDFFFSPNIGFSALSRACKHILTVHDLSFELYPEYLSLKRRLWHRWLNPKKQCEEAYHILTPSQNTKQDIIHEYGITQQNVHVVYPGVSDDRLQITDYRNAVKEKYRLPEKFLLFLGTIEPRKNIEAATQAFEVSQLVNEGYEFIIAGSLGWKYKNIMKNIEQTEGVRYIGYIKEGEKRALYELSSIFVYTSFYEGFGFPVLEAFRYRVPVITSNCSSLPEIVGQAACLVSPRRVDEIAQAMKEVLRSEDLRSMLTQSGTAQVKQFSWEKAATQFLSLLYL